MSDPYIPSEAPTGAPMNDVELDKIILTLVHKGGFIPRGKTINAGMFPEEKARLQALFTQEKANLQAALEAEQIPVIALTWKKPHEETQIQAVPLEAIAAVFNKGDR